MSEIEGRSGDCGSGTGEVMSANRMGNKGPRVCRLKTTVEAY